MSIWEMTLDKALEYLKKQKFVGGPTDIFNKLLIFKGSLYHIPRLDLSRQHLWPP
jgi:hypothetical protein